MGRDFQRVLRFGGQQDHVKLVSLSVLLNCGNVDSVCPHLSSDAGHSQARSAQHLRGFGIASRKPGGQSSAEGARGNCSTQRADAHYQYLHREVSKMPAMKRPRRQNPGDSIVQVLDGAAWRRRMGASMLYETSADDGTSISPLAM